MGNNACCSGRLGPLSYSISKDKQPIQNTTNGNGRRDIIEDQERQQTQNFENEMKFQDELEILKIQQRERNLTICKLQSRLKNSFYLYEKTQFLNVIKKKFINHSQNVNGVLTIPEEYFSQKVIEVNQKSKQLNSILQEKYPKLYSQFTKISKWRVSLPPVKSDSDEVYYGSWNILTNKYSGYGVLASKNGSKFEGIWLEGLLHFYGRIILSNGDYYEGDLTYGKSDGYGIFRHYEGGYYIGNFLNDKMHGFGEEHFVDNSLYKGQYFEGKKSGKGKYTWLNSFYIGEVFDDKLHGYGEMTWDDGRYFKGEFDQDLYHGIGIYYSKEGTTYQGEFIDNKKNGLGKFTWSEDKKYNGFWSNGKQNGYGMLYKDGTITYGKWNEGKFLLSIPN